MAFDYTLDWSDGSLKPSFILPEATIDTTTTSLALTGNRAVNWGERVQENFIRLLENFASNGTPPAHPTLGQLWYDRSAGRLKIYGSTGFTDVLAPALAQLATIDLASLQAQINTLKSPRMIRMSYIGGAWYDWWGGVNMVNFNGLNPTRPGMANVWQPVANSIAANAEYQPMAYISSVTKNLVSTWEVAQPTRLGMQLSASATITNPIPTVASINWIYKFERSTDHGATWTFWPQTQNNLWGHLKDGTGTVIGYTSNAAIGAIKGDGSFERTNNMVLPGITPPDSGLTSHLINPAGVDQGAWLVDEIACAPGYMYRFTLYANVGSQTSNCSLRAFGGNCSFLLMGE